MMGTAVARNALQIDAKKHLGGTNGQLIVSVLMIHSALVRLINIKANEKIGRSRIEIRGCCGGQQPSHKLVVRLVDGQKIINVVIKERSATVHQGIHSKQIRKEISPAVEKRRGGLFGNPLGTGGHEGVHYLVPLLGIAVFDKLPNPVG